MIKVNRLILPNGLRIVHSEDRSTQMVAINVLYDVGARDEEEGRTGFAHLFEHLMFGGSVNIPDYDEPVQEAGGENNAWTTNDHTNYYVTLPKQNVEVGFRSDSNQKPTTSPFPSRMSKWAFGWSPTECWAWPFRPKVLTCNARW